jgi:phospholipase/carboxylesterase
VASTEGRAFAQGNGGVGMLKELDGPRREPHGRAASAVVVLLHGYGANGDDLIPLGDEWRRALPGAAFIAPNAPQPIPNMPGALQWFGLTMRDPGEYWRGVVAARPALDRFLDRELARYRLPPGRLVLVGFSQGTMMALHTGLWRTSGPAAIVGFSGLLAGPEHLGETTAHPPILLIHGEADELIPADALHIAREPLAQAGLLVEWHVRPGLGHGIDPEGVATAGHFMVHALRG